MSAPPRLDVRPKTPADDAAVAGILAAATAELRRVYRRAPAPGGSAGADGGEAPQTLVAVEDGAVVGVVECCLRPDAVYVRGLAVHPRHRRRGVARALLRAAEAIAVGAGRARLTLCAIRETGNPAIFARLGFAATGEAAAEGFEGADGQPVTRVDMGRPVGR
ncbi:MAG: GNAT family N-acetyltransferase [Gammaproteobacteria bacterium]|nr:GNAT family N-acetyltransferase [Gammaproteobacteria bacterium]